MQFILSFSFMRISPSFNTVPLAKRKKTSLPFANVNLWRLRVRSSAVSERVRVTIVSSLGG
jgi:hypothetical protein